MAEVVIYGTNTCSYCERAKQLFARKHIDYTEIRVDLDQQQREIMQERSGRRTVPQIFIDDKHIGGCDDLYALENNGELDKLLG